MKGVVISDVVMLQYPFRFFAQGMMKLRIRWSVLIIICLVIVVVLLTIILGPSSSFEKSVHTLTSDLIYNEKEVKNIELPRIQSIFNHPASVANLWIKVATTVLIRRLAYHDTRNKSHVIIIINAMIDDRPNFHPQLYALLTYSNGSRYCVPLEYWIQSGKLEIFNREFHVNYLMRTKTNISLTEKPVHLSLTTDEKCQNYLSGLIPIQGEDPTAKKFTYGICMHQALFKRERVQELVDWVELNKELGAEIITVYFQSVPDSMYEAMIPYIETGLVEVLDWNLIKAPTIFASNKGYGHDGQSGLINECLYRNLYRVKYLALIDIDEFIVPGLKFERCPEMLQHLDELTKSKPTSAYMFYNTHFFDDNITVPEARNVHLCPKMHLPLYFQRTQRATNPEKYGWNKLVVKPEAVDSVQIHHIVSQRAGYIGEYEVPNDIGLSHHYRYPYRMKHLTPHEYCAIMGRYVDNVLPRIKSQMCK